jgi:DNA-binding transcriptional MerR regulator
VTAPLVREPVVRDTGGVTGSRADEAGGRPIGEVARRLGVSPDTLRTWDRRYGLGPSGRSPGGHRRYLEVEVGRLRELQQLLFAGEPVATAAARVLGRGAEPVTRRGGGRGVLALPRSADDATRGLARAAMALDVRTMHRLIRTGLAARGVIRAWDELLVPILIGVGERTGRSGDCIDVEHALSECVLAAVARGDPDGAGVRPSGERLSRAVVRSGGRAAHPPALCAGGGARNRGRGHVHAGRAGAVRGVGRRLPAG